MVSVCFLPDGGTDRKGGRGDGERDMTDLARKLEKLEALSGKATPGPWVRSLHSFQILTADSMHSVTELSCPRGMNKMPSDAQIRQWQNNVEMVVAAVNFVRTELKELVGRAARNAEIACDNKWIASINVHLKEAGIERLWASVKFPCQPFFGDVLEAYGQRLRELEAAIGKPAGKEVE
jgi:hypothetical protein